VLFLETLDANLDGRRPQHARFPEIGERLRAYRLASGLSVDEIAAQLGVSRAAVYRFEKGEVVKIETIDRLARLLGVSVPSLLGVGVEYVASAVAFFERLRQLEERTDRISVLFGPVAYLLTSEGYDRALHDVLVESIPPGVPDRKRAEAEIDAVMEILKRRKETYRERRPGVVSVIAAPEVERFLSGGLVAATRPRASVLAARRRMARREMEHVADLMEREPMGVQIGVVLDSLPMTGFHILRQRDTSVVAISSFRLGYHPSIRVGMAMITSAEEALRLHSRVIEDLWARALKGKAGARYLRSLIARR